MKYDFVCKSCAVVSTFDMSVDEFTEQKNSMRCVPCGGELEFKFDAKSVDFCFAGDAWPDKNYREKEYRKGRSSYLAARQSKNNHVPKLVPNFNGEETSTWKEAQQEAHAAGKISETYDKLVKKEASAQ